MLQLAAGGAVGMAAGAIGLNPREGRTAPQAAGAAPPGPAPAAPAQAGVAPGKAAAKTTGKRPWNVLMLVSDEHNPHFIDAVSPWIGTPNLNRLCREGVRASNVYATSPICAPARMGLLTGLFPTETGVLGNGQALDPRTPTIANSFGAAGYETICLGKTHVSYPGAAFGFDTWLSPESDAYKLAAAGFKAETRALPVPAEDRALWDGVSDHRLRGAPIEAERTLMSGVVLDHAELFLTNRAQEKPFFLYVSWTEPHWFWNLPAAFYGRHRTEDTPLPPWAEGDLDGSPLARSFQLANGWDRMSEAQHRLCRARYADAVSYTDWVVGQLLGMLDRHGLAENTVVLYTSDHGDMAAEKRMWLKSIMFEPAVKVPAVIRMPGVLPPNTSTDALISGADLFPTLASLAGVPLATPVSGREQTEVLKGKRGAGQDAVFSCIHGRASTRMPGNFMVRDARYKLVRYRNPAPDHKDEVRELYDMVDDPAETRNLAGDRARRSTVSELVARGDTWLQSRTICPYPLLRANELLRGEDGEEPEEETDPE